MPVLQPPKPTLRILGSTQSSSCLQQSVPSPPPVPLFGAAVTAQVPPTLTLSPEVIRISHTHLCWLLMLRCHHQESPLTHQTCVDHLSLRTDTNMREISLCHVNKSPHTDLKAHSWRNPPPEEPHQSVTAQGWGVFRPPKGLYTARHLGFPGEGLIHPECVGV